MPLAIGVDIGGTKVLAGVVDDAGVVIDTTRRLTPGSDVAETEAVIADAVRELSSRHQVAAVGIGAATYRHALSLQALRFEAAPGSGAGFLAAVRTGFAGAARAAAANRPRWPQVGRRSGFTVGAGGC